MCYLRVIAEDKAECDGQGGADGATASSSPALLVLPAGSRPRGLRQRPAKGLQN